MKLNVYFFLVVFFVSATEITQGQAPKAVNQPATGIATMFARDPITQTFCFEDGDFGSTIQNGQVLNRCSNLSYNAYNADAFTVGIEGGREGVILDLGTTQDLKSRYSYLDSVGFGQGFASIDVRNGEGVIVQDFRKGTRQELKEATQLFQAPKSAASASVKLGHIYLIRVTDPKDKAYEVLGKMLVLAYVPGESVTIRWQLLGEAQNASVSKPSR